jgi:hypothetical protein
MGPTVNWICISRYLIFISVLLAGCQNGPTWRQFTSGSTRTANLQSEAQFQPLNLKIELPVHNTKLALAEGEEVIGLGYKTIGGEFCWGKPDDTYFVSPKDEKILLNKNASGCKLLVTSLYTTGIGSFTVPADHPGLDIQVAGTTMIFASSYSDAEKAQVKVEKSPFGDTSGDSELVLSVKAFTVEDSNLTFVQTFSLNLPVKFDPCVDDVHPITGESVAIFELSGNVIKNIDITSTDKYARIVLDAEKRIKKININLENPEGRYCLSMTTDSGTIKKVTTNLACGAKLSGLTMNAGNRIKKVKFVGGCNTPVDESFSEESDGGQHPRAFNAFLDRMPSEIVSVTVNDLQLDAEDREMMIVDGQTITFMDPYYQFRSDQILRVEYRSQSKSNPGVADPTHESKFDACVDAIHTATNEIVRQYTFDARVIKKDVLTVSDRFANVIFSAYRRINKVHVTFEQPYGQYCLNLSTERGAIRNITYSLSCGSKLRILKKERGKEGEPETIFGPSCQ